MKIGLITAFQLLRVAMTRPKLTLLLVQFLTIAVLIFCVDFAASCSTRTTLSDPEGTVTANSLELNYRRSGINVDHCWLIRINYPVEIKFTFFIYGSICRTVHLYEKSESPDNTTERFRLDADSAALSEFWMPGPVLVRCQSNGASWRAGFGFQYKQRAPFTVNFQGTSDYNTGPATEIINAIAGVRHSHPDFGSKDYTNNLIVAWSFRADYMQSVWINFVSFNSESCCDMLKAFQGVTPNLGNQSLFNITGRGHSGVEHVFRGSVTLVFRTDGSVIERGFQFQFCVADYANSSFDPEFVRVEFLQPELWSLTGMIQFHAVSESVCPSVRHRCELKTASGDTLAVQMVNQILSPPVAPQCHSSVTSQFSLVAPPSIITGSVIHCHQQNGTPATYRVPDMSWPSEVKWHTSNCTGRSASFIELTLKPAVRFSVTAVCYLHHECTNYATELYFSSRRMNISSNLQETALQIGDAIQYQIGYCIDNATCQISAPGMRNFRKYFSMPSAEPESIRIELLQPELWSLTGMIQFHAVSESVCPSVRHRCELKTASGKSFLAQHIKLTVSDPVGPQCLSSITTQFSVVAQPSVVAGATIICRRANGSSELLLPQRINVRRLAGVWELPLLVGSTVTAAITIIVLLAVGFVLFRMNKRQMKEHDEPKPKIQLQHPAPIDVFNEQYGDSTACASEDREVYIA